jgi:hypothetical protein
MQELNDKFDDMHNRGIMEIFTEDDEMMYFKDPE